MSSFDDDAPPVVAPPVRRDPTISIEPPSPDTPAHPTYTDAEPAPRGLSWYTAVAVSVVAGVAVVFALILVGLVAREVGRAIILGWNLG